jgi:Spy/CpxP family protein refolding chaperone
MKKLLGIAVAAAVLTAVASTYAGDVKMSCCSGQQARDACCGEMSTKLNLTADQQARITALNGQLRTATSKSERRAMFGQGMQRILTADQYAQWKSASDKMARSGACPFMAIQADSGKSS